MYFMWFICFLIRNRGNNYFYWSNISCGRELTQVICMCSYVKLHLFPQASERLELELLHWRSAESGNGDISDSEGSEADASLSGEKYKRRYERAHRELQLLRAQLRRQHEDDLEQLVMVKKQLEKKVSCVYPVQGNFLVYCLL